MEPKNETQFYNEKEYAVVRSCEYILILPDSLRYIYRLILPSLPLLFLFLSTRSEVIVSVFPVTPNKILIKKNSYRQTINGKFWLEMMDPVFLGINRRLWEGGGFTKCCRIFNVFMLLVSCLSRKDKAPEDSPTKESPFTVKLILLINFI